MKFPKLLISIALIFISCNDRTESTGFKNPQPMSGKDCIEIPGVLHGNYRLQDPTEVLLGLKPNFNILKNNTGESKVNLSHLLAITKDSINNKLNGYFEILKSDLNSSERKNMHKNYVDSLILSLFSKPTYTYLVDSSGLSYKVNIHVSANLYSTDNKHVIKKFRNKYYFNTYNKLFKVWKCYQMDFDRKKKILKINSLSENDYEVLKRLMKLENGAATATDELDPSKRNFIEFLKLGGFENHIILEKK